MNDKNNNSGKTLKAYENKDFLNSRDARTLRILSEYIEPHTRFEDLKISDTIVFQGSARIPSREAALKKLDEAKAKGFGLERAEMDLEMSRYYEDARELAKRITEWSKALDDQRKRYVVCTGGGPGIMEAANRGASEARGMNVGLNISLPFEQHANPYITHQLNFEFHYFFMRKLWFVYLAKAFVIFPGGFGTFDEFYELLTLIQTTKIKRKIPIVLYGTDFWDEVVNMDALVKYGTIGADDLNLFYRANSVDQAYDYITCHLDGTCDVIPGGSL